MPQKFIPLEKLFTDGSPASGAAGIRGYQCREGISQEHVEDLTEAVREKCDLPPIKVFFDDTLHYVAGGFHRILACYATGLKVILADVQEGTERDALLAACAENTTHGLRRTREDKRRAAMTLLADAEWAKWSNRQIASQCGVSEGLIRGLRAMLAMPAKDRVGCVNTHLGRDGKAYPAKRFADLTPEEQAAAQESPERPKCPTCGRTMP